MFDVVYLGSGHSVWHGAITLAAAGKRIAIVDGDLPGGTCTNYGCDAKIILDGPFEFAEGLERYQDLCVEGNGTIDWHKLMDYKRQVLAPFPRCSRSCSRAQASTSCPSSAPSSTPIP